MSHSWVPFTFADLPPTFVARIKESLPESGPAWLESLPALIQESARRWGLRVERWFPNLSFNFVMPATMEDGRQVVLKAGGFYEDFEFEVAATRAYGGRGCCQVIDDDLDRHVVLLERLNPGSMLSELPDDEEATRIAADVFQALRAPVPRGINLPTIGTWGLGLQKARKQFDGGTGPFRRDVFEFAERMFAKYQPSNGDILLHGDLHHFNILRAERSAWLAIDPHGVIGPPEYEIGGFLRNPTIQRSTDVAMQSRRIDTFCEALGYDRRVVIEWSVAQAVLSAYWCIDEGQSSMPEGPVETLMALAELL